MTRKEQLLEAIQLNYDALAKVASAKVSKIGAVWMRQTYRANIKRLKAELKELKECSH